MVELELKVTELQSKLDTVIQFCQKLNTSLQRSTSHSADKQDLEVASLKFV